MKEKNNLYAFRLGLVIIFALLLFSIGIFWIGKKQFIFHSTYRLTANFPNVAGLIEGSVVRVGGIQKGTVKQINLPSRPDQSVQLVMELVVATRSVVRKDSKASISSEGLVGDKYVEISFGSPDSPPADDGDTITALPPLQISDLINKANGLLDTANSSMESINATADNLKNISSKINQGTGSVGALINDKSLYTNMNAGVTALSEDMQALKRNFLLRGFFKDRGYEDSTQLSKNQIAELPARPPQKQFAFDGEKLFDKPTTAKLKREKMLDEAGRYMEQNPFGLAVIAAYTDMKGDTEKDRTLTQARAMVAREYMVQHFKIDDTRIKTIGLGKSDEIGGTSQVHILVFPPGVSAPKEAKPTSR